MPPWALFRGGRRLSRNDENTDRTVATPSQAGVELRPRGHAVDVSCHPGLWERVELRPAPRFDRTRSDLQRESPVRGIDPGRGSGRKHQEIVDEVLPWRNPVR
jgi:hypothetical protein